MGFLVIKTTHRNTLITLCNWDIYQNEKELSGTLPGTEREPTGNQEGIERATNKNDKECKNERTPYIPQTGEGGVSEGALRLLRMVGLSPQQTGGSQDE
jgi:hypothetical protein